MRTSRRASGRSVGRVSPYVRTVKTSSGATAVQIVYSSRRGSREIEHLGSAHDDAEVELLKAAARQRLAAGQDELDLGLQPDADGGGPLPITSSRMGHLWDALARAYAVLGLEEAAGGDEVFRDLVLARIIEPTSTLPQRPAGRGRRRPGLLSHGQPAPAGLCPGRLAAKAVGDVRGACGAGSGQPGPVRRVDAVLRPMPVTGSGSRGSPRNAAWSRRSPSGCSPTPAASP